jgi:hypothetical protein
MVRQTSSAFRVLKNVSTMALSKKFPCLISRSRSRSSQLGRQVLLSFGAAPPVGKHGDRGPDHDGACQPRSGGRRHGVEQSRHVELGQQTARQVGALIGADHQFGAGHLQDFQGGDRARKWRLS